MTFFTGEGQSLKSHRDGLPIRGIMTRRDLGECEADRPGPAGSSPQRSSPRQSRVSRDLARSPPKDRHPGMFLAGVQRLFILRYEKKHGFRLRSTAGMTRFRLRGTQTRNEEFQAQENCRKIESPAPSFNGEVNRLNAGVLRHRRKIVQRKPL